MTATFIPKGYGFNVGQDFARATEDTYLEVDTKRDCWIYGYIAGNPQSSLGFLRPNRVRVRVRCDCVKTVTNE